MSGTSAVAVPVSDAPGQVVAAISSATLAERMGRAREGAEGARIDHTDPHTSLVLRLQVWILSLLPIGELL